MPAERFVDTAEWKRLRLTILQRDLWFCQVSGDMLREGMLHPQSAVVDHIIPRAIAPELEAHPGNLWAVARHIHDGPMASIERAKKTPAAILNAKLAHRWIGLDGYPTDIKRHHQIGAGILECLASAAS